MSDADALIRELRVLAKELRPLGKIARDVRELRRAVQCIQARVADGVKDPVYPDDGVDDTAEFEADEARRREAERERRERELAVDDPRRIPTRRRLGL